VTVHVEPLSRELTPSDAAGSLLDLPYPILLESALRMPHTGRYSFVAADPYATIRSAAGRTLASQGGRDVMLPASDPFDTVRALLPDDPPPSLPGLPPFQGGAAGYFGYELGHHLERLPRGPRDDLHLPDLCVAYYDVVLAWDHEAGDAWLISTGLPEPEGPRRAERARGRAARFLDALDRPTHRPRDRVASPHRDERRATPVRGFDGVASTFPRAAYEAAIARVVEYIHAGDAFQVNLTHRLRAAIADDAWTFHRRLSRRNAAPFSAYFDIGDAVICSASPERFLRVSGSRVDTRPIKGTARRDPDPAEDGRLRDSLLSSEKDRAENVMIVDLLRNDLSRVCMDGSIEVPALCEVESYARVHHLVSEVTGDLRDGVGPLDALRAAFPGGSITGAPKVRAMEIISELERTRRGIYTGAIGYMGADGSMDTSIAIRTVTIRDGIGFFGVGGGIVADSHPAAEWEETLHKARGIIDALEP